MEGGSQNNCTKLRNVLLNNSKVLNSKMRVKREKKEKKFKEEINNKLRYILDPAKVLKFFNNLIK